MNKPIVKHVVIGIALTVATFVISVILPGLFDSADRAIQRQYYHVRGEHPIDSSIVILYFGNEDINALGGLPLKRNYYALLVSALHDVGASAIGFDIGFPESDREHPEYDQVFAGSVKSAGNVVFSGYFSSFQIKEKQVTVSQPEQFSYSLSNNGIFLDGQNLEKPFPGLLHSASSLGHTNLIENLHIPIVIRSQHGDIPAFSFELLRTGLHAFKEDVTNSGNTLSLALKGKALSIPYDNKGEISPNFTGGISSLKTTSVLRFLKEYDEWKSQPEVAANSHPFYNKIILIAIIAEGKSMFVQTPFDNQFPSVGIHATVIDNILSGSLLKEASTSLVWILSLLLGLIATLLFLQKKQSIAIASILVLTILLTFFSYKMFAAYAYVLPISQPLAVLLVVSIGFIFYKQSLVQSKLFSAENEKQLAEQRLQEKESYLSALEQRLQISQQNTTQQPSVELLLEIKKYKEEIESLKTLVEDYKPTTVQSVAQTETSSEFQGIIYSPSSKMSEVISFIKKISATDASVLILGESGTGKELVANAIHQASKRSSQPFIAVNCGALTETLLESELFGHEKGAFTGAVKEKAGRFELADNGTIFLDEIAEISEAFQVKLLRILQEGTFERVGGTETKKVNVRVIAATNRDIKSEVTNKRFREDVYYRLNVFTLSLPPLRERKEDIPPLVQKFIKAENPNMEISATVMNLLLQHEWKGNVRELQSIVKHALVLAQSEGRTLLRIKDLPKEFTANLTMNLDIEEQILESLRSKQFARSAITETASELGGLNRGTVAEYFRGYCFKSFCENNWDINKTIDRITESSDPVVRERVTKKLEEYLTNAIELAGKELPLETTLTVSKPKMKNLPQRYHNYFELVIKAYLDGLWKKP